jgi:hypothetical protein
MAELIVLMVIIIAPLAAFGIAALNWGVDSRDGSTDSRSPARPIGIS